MIDKVWFSAHPVKYLLWPLLWPLSKLFSFISTKRRYEYQSGKKRSYRAPVPVIVVGNITAGGNGKTPVVIWLVEQLQQLGYQPGVVSRGYGAKAPSYPLLVESTTSTKHCGDEPKLIHRRTGVPVAVSPVRSDAVKALLPLGVDIIITDDGLQHYALQRDIEIVVVDGIRRFGNQALLPMGPLRESVQRLNEVDLIITNGGDAHAGELAMTLEPQLAVNLLTGEQVDVTELDGLVAIAGIGHPPRFFHTLEQLGAKLVHAQGFADHEEIQVSRLDELAQKGQHLIMTEKDAVKCADDAKQNWWFLPVSASFGQQDQTHILNIIKEVKEKYGSPSA
ncbi:tetraacyldisaccharide 4'-kinase [Vibrio sp. JPW-9-11-11]|uniref:tetraacyldisaccharide 4'-kinase n=1 Tax=Vibrio sp. JPW-9-11-11 TaxID=1416532 RepID=UPI001594A521|nr:tetraacyldisaccharide 4'-kinase [Vibrio sp. JPW-9-11-11]NVD06937.1 tetraacyldisaccharide 4'-kinase [Vibrio sp. JPW-9-11-11]